MFRFTASQLCSYCFSVYCYVRKLFCDNPLACVSHGHHLSTNQISFYPLLSCFPARSHLLSTVICVTPARVYCRPSATGRVLFKDRLSLMSPLAGNNSLTVFGEEQFKQLSFCCEGFTFQQTTPETRDLREGAGVEWHHNGFLKSRRRAYKLYSFPHFSHRCVTHSLRFACFHATPGCVRENGGVSGEG